MAFSVYLPSSIDCLSPSTESIGLHDTANHRCATQTRPPFIPLPIDTTGSGHIAHCALPCRRLQLTFTVGQHDGRRSLSVVIEHLPADRRHLEVLLRLVRRGLFCNPPWACNHLWSTFNGKCHVLHRLVDVAAVQAEQPPLPNAIDLPVRIDAGGSAISPNPYRLHSTPTLMSPPLLTSPPVSLRPLPAHCDANNSQPCARPCQLPNMSQRSSPSCCPCASPLLLFLRAPSPATCLPCAPGSRCCSSLPHRTRGRCVVR